MSEYKNKIDLKSMTLDELICLVEGLGAEKYRGEQIFRWISKGVNDFKAMKNIPKSLQEKLEDRAFIENLSLEKLQVSKKDGTRKYVFNLGDSGHIESVFLRYSYGNSVCISSQAGCRMGCSFCASTIGGLSRNLSAGEMVDQVLSIGKDTGAPIGNVVVMGIGEPFDNYDNLSKFLKIMNSDKGLNMGYRSITVSTCGLIPKIKQFAKDFPQVNLAVSLHGPNDEIRSRLMPINKKYPLEDLLKACRDYVGKTRRRITFEYALIEGLNDGKAHGIELARKLKGILCHVNLIPLNEIGERKYKATARNKTDEFHQILKDRGVQVTIRRSLGADIDGACGQLRARS